MVLKIHKIYKRIFIENSIPFLPFLYLSFKQIPQSETQTVKVTTITGFSGILVKFLYMSISRYKHVH